MYVSVFYQPHISVYVLSFTFDEMFFVDKDFLIEKK